MPAPKQKGREIKAQTSGPSKLPLELSFPEAGWGQWLVASVAASGCPVPSSPQWPAHPTPVPKRCQQVLSPRRSTCSLAWQVGSCLTPGIQLPRVKPEHPAFGQRVVGAGQQGHAVGLEEERWHWAPGWAEALGCPLLAGGLRA